MAVNYLHCQPSNVSHKLLNFQRLHNHKCSNRCEASKFTLKCVFLQLHTHRLASSCEFTLYTVFIWSPMVKFMAC